MEKETLQALGLIEMAISRVQVEPETLPQALDVIEGAIRNIREAEGIDAG